MKSGTFTIPTSGHDFSGNTRYRVTLTVTDSTGVSDTKVVTVWPTKVNSGTGTTATSGNVTTTSASELLVGAGMTSGTFTGSSAGFTTRIITPIDADIVNDRLVTSVGTYSAGATQSGSANWVMQVATFRAAGQ